LRALRFGLMCGEMVASGWWHAGFNCAEAVNFAPADWLPFGAFAVERYRFYHKAAVLSHDELLCVVAKVCNAAGGRVVLLCIAALCRGCVRMTRRRDRW
jgi:hypothetical protein